MKNILPIYTPKKVVGGQDMKIIRMYYMLEIHLKMYFEEQRDIQSRSEINQEEHTDVSFSIEFKLQWTIPSNFCTLYYFG